MDKKHYFTKHADLSAEEMSTMVAWRIIVARSWSDTPFKERLTKEPSAVLAEYGVQVPAGLELRIVHDVPGVKHLVIPEKQAEITMVDTGFCPDPGF